MRIIVGDVNALMAHPVRDGRGRESHVNQKRHRAMTNIVDSDARHPGFFGSPVHLPVKIALGDGKHPVIQPDAVKHLDVILDFLGQKLRHSDDPITLLYGHNMKNGSIFGTLQYYLDKSYYEKHKTMSFDTLYKRYDYQIVAVGLSKITDESADTFKYYDFLNAAGEKEFDNFKEKIKSLEVYDTGVKMKYGDKLITLSTCNSVEKNGRLFVIAKRN